MLEINLSKNNFDCNQFNIKTYEGDFYITLVPKLGLFFCCKNDLNNDVKKFIISKENYKLYLLFDKLYKSIKDQKIYTKSQNDFDSINLDNSKVFKDNKVIWYSDEVPIKEASILQIVKEEDYYKIIFNKSKSFFPTFNVMINSHSSKNNPYNIPFMNLYKELEKLNYDEFHQIHMEEYMFKQKVLKKKM